MQVMVRVAGRSVACNTGNSRCGTSVDAAAGRFNARRWKTVTRSTLQSRFYLLAQHLAAIALALPGRLRVRLRRRAAHARYRHSLASKHSRGIVDGPRITQAVGAGVPGPFGAYGHGLMEFDAIRTVRLTWTCYSPFC